MKYYKAFNKGMMCRGKQYEEGKEYEEKGGVICGAGMMHFCETPFDTLDYYPLIDSDGNFSEFAEVEPLAPEGNALVQGGKEHVPVAAEAVDRNGQEAVVAAGVARHDGRVAERASLARQQNLPLERVGQVDKFRLVEFQKCHIGVVLHFP